MGIAHATLAEPVFDDGGKLLYKGHGASTIGITSSVAISGTIPAGSVLALSGPKGGGSETCGAPAFINTAPPAASPSSKEQP